ncbi:hypothetical protein DFH27DRAFT_529885 [Peziza echinospora]|nr:hypothetical protein DFH27DRAFT_529885 [Peziza echinospora]
MGMTPVTALSSPPSLASSNDRGRVNTHMASQLGVDPSQVYNPRHLLRSRSLSPSINRTTYPKAYAVVGATQCGVVIGPMSTRSTKSSSSNYASSSMNSSSTTFVSPPFISTRARPMLYHRGNLSSSNSLSHRGRSRSRSSAPSPAGTASSSAATVVPSPSFASAMMPPMAPLSSQVSYSEGNSSHVSRSSSRCTSPVGSARSVTTGSASTKRGLLSKLKNFVKGGEGKEMTVVYMTPEEAKIREQKIKRAFAGGHVITKGAMGI